VDIVSYLFLSFPLRAFLHSVTSFIRTKIYLHNILNTYIHFIYLYPACFDVCYTIFRETIALLVQKMHAFIIFLYLILKECLSTLFLPVVFHVPVTQFPISVQTENRKFSVSIKPRTEL
jgi:hypothetical protein